LTKTTRSNSCFLPEVLRQYPPGDFSTEVVVPESSQLPSESTCQYPLGWSPTVVTAVGPEADGWIRTSCRAVRPLDTSNSPAMTVGSLRPKALYLGRPEIPRRELFRRSATPAGLSRCPFLTLPEGLVSVSNPCGGTGGPGGRGFDSAMCPLCYSNVPAYKEYKVVEKSIYWHPM